MGITCEHQFPKFDSIQHVNTLPHCSSECMFSHCSAERRPSASASSPGGFPPELVLHVAPSVFLWTLSNFHVPGDEKASPQQDAVMWGWCVVQDDAAQFSRTAIDNLCKMFKGWGGLIRYPVISGTPDIFSLLLKIHRPCSVVLL